MASGIGGLPRIPVAADGRVPSRVSVEGEVPLDALDAFDESFVWGSCSCCCSAVVD